MYNTVAINVKHECWMTIVMYLERMFLVYYEACMHVWHL